MKIGVAGIGLWGRGLANWNEFETGLRDGFAGESTGPAAPAPAAIPPRERRRAPLSVKMAIEVIQQAAAMAAIDEQTLCSVFASAMGDSHITDYICRTLAGGDKALSPTKFHNSVHNTASGYWSITTGNRLPSTFVSACRNSFPVALFEAAALAHSEGRPTVLAIYDVAYGVPLFDVCPIAEDFAAAFVLTPDPDAAKWQLDINVTNTAATAVGSSNAYVAERITQNPSAAALTLGELLVGATGNAALWPLGSATALQVRAV